MPVNRKTHQLPAARSRTSRSSNNAFIVPMGSSRLSTVTRRGASSCFQPGFLPYDPPVIVERSMHPSWLSNAYLVGDAPGGTAVFVDSGAPLAPLHAAVERSGLNVT